MAQLGTIKLQTDSGIVDVPVFDVGDSGGSTSEALRVQTDSGIGFVPLVDPADASSPQEAIRVQTDSGVKAVTDSARLFTNPVAVSDLVAWYPFDPSSYDGMTNNADDATDGLTGAGDTTAFDGTVNGANYLSSGGVTDVNAGANSGAFDFDGASDFIDISSVGSSFDFDGPRTFMMWFESTSDGFLIEARDSSNLRAVDISIKNGDLGFNRSPETETVVLSNADDGNYHHVAFAADGSEINAIVDGSFVTSMTPDATFDATPNTVYVAARNGGGGTADGHFDGKLDDVRVYNKKLTTSEVSNIHTNTQP